ncbi:hypothetical protein GALL_355410 [mine drainage metagenome]|uniref:Uncharacterized protein n=1 Tax=mine drainage metagenome TaxID=410659 RepID=A0A1J5R3D4_9ZZZZ
MIAGRRGAVTARAAQPGGGHGLRARDTVAVVARREIAVKLHDRAFLGSTVFMLLVVALAVAIPAFIQGQTPRLTVAVRGSAAQQDEGAAERERDGQPAAAGDALAQEQPAGQHAPDRGHVEQQHHPHDVTAHQRVHERGIGPASENGEQHEQARLPLPLPALQPQHGKPEQGHDAVAGDHHQVASDSLGAEGLQRPPGHAPQHRAGEQGQNGRGRGGGELRGHGPGYAISAPPLGLKVWPQ